MKMIALNLCAASLALGPLAVGAWAAAQGGDTPSKPVPAAGAEQTIHLCKLGDVKDLDLNAEGEKKNVGLKAEMNAGPAPRYVSTLELKGAEVRSPADKEIGKIEEMVIAPDDAMVAYNVLATGGVLGLGEKRFALPWQVTEISYDKDK